MPADMGESTFIRIPSPRVKQLRALARVRNTTMTGLIDEIVTRAILNGEIPDETPGLSLRQIATSDLDLRIGRERYIASFQQAKTLFRWLGESTTGASPPRKLGTLTRSLELRKAGTALILKIKRSGRSVARFSMTGNIPADVRRQMAAAFENDGWLRRELET